MFDYLEKDRMQHKSNYGLLFCRYHCLVNASNVAYGKQFYIYNAVAVLSNWLLTLFLETN